MKIKIQLLYCYIRIKTSQEIYNKIRNEFCKTGNDLYNSLFGIVRCDFHWNEEFFTLLQGWWDKPLTSHHVLMQLALVDKNSPPSYAAYYRVEKKTVRKARYDKSRVVANEQHNINGVNPNPMFFLILASANPYKNLHK